MISEDLLLAHGADYEKYKINQSIFREGTLPQFYFQIVNGCVELTGYHVDGKEFTYNILNDGEGLGAALFNNKSYPINAVCRTECNILRLSKSGYLNLLHQNPEVSLQVIKSFSELLYDNYAMLFSMSSGNPILKIKTILDNLKGDHFCSEKYSFRVPLTRQQIANLTGLRVETVVRTIKKMERCEIVRITSGKIYY